MFIAGYKATVNTSNNTLYQKKQNKEKAQITSLLNQSTPNFTGASDIRPFKKLGKVLFLPIIFSAGLIGGAWGGKSFDEHRQANFKKEMIDDTFNSYNKTHSIAKTIDTNKLEDLIEYNDYSETIIPEVKLAAQEINTELSNDYSEKIIDIKNAHNTNKIIDNYNKALLNKVAQKILTENNENLSPQYADSISKFRKELVNILAESINKEAPEIKKNVSDKAIHILTKGDDLSEYSKADNIKTLLHNYGNCVLEAPVGDFDLKIEKKQNEEIKNAIKTLYKEIDVKIEDKDIDKMISTIKEKESDKPMKTTDVMFFLLIVVCAGCSVKNHFNTRKIRKENRSEKD